MGVLVRISFTTRWFESGGIEASFPSLQQQRRLLLELRAVERSRVERGLLGRRPAEQRRQLHGVATLVREVVRIS